MADSPARTPELQIDLRRYELRYRGELVRLEKLPFELLVLLAENQGEVVNRKKIHQRVWGDGVFIETDKNINVAIRKIRQALGDDPDEPRLVQTVIGRGYRLIAPVHLIPKDDTSGDSPTAMVAKSAPRWAFSSANAGRLSLMLTPVTAALLIMAGMWWLRVAHARTVQEIHTLAVLPLKNLSGDASQEYFADGMTDELITQVAKLGDLQVISSTSVMRFKKDTSTIPEIGRQLGADAVLEGSVVREGDRVRITVQLIRTTTDHHLWAESYERDLKDVLFLQHDIATDVGQQIHMRFGAHQPSSNTAARQIDPKAYEAYLLGGYFASKRNPAALEKAIAYFQDSIRMEPDYAQAYAGLATAHFARDIWGGLGIGRSADQVRHNTLKALELNGDLAEAHALLGDIYFGYDWDWAHAEAEFKRAIELNANFARSYEQYAFFLQAMGRQQEAIAAVHRAVELDPLSAWCTSEEGRILYRARRYEDAIARYQRALELDPGYLPALWRIAEAYEQLGKYDEALMWSVKYQQATGDPSLDLALRARMYAHIGKRREAVEALRGFEKGDMRGNEHLLAGIYCALGDHDRAIAELERGIQTHSFLPFVFADPQLDPLRSDPRFQQLLRLAGLPS